MTKVSLSPSKCDCFNGCQKLYYFKYIKKIPAPPNKWFLIGNIAHKALELFHKKTQAIDRDVSNEKWKKYLGMCFKEAYKRYHASDRIQSGLIVKDDMISVKEMLLKYMEHIIKNGMPKIKQVEKMCSFSINGFKVRMKMDRLDILGENEYKIVDYKTSSKPATKKDELASVQLPTYGLWVKQNFGEESKILGEYQYLRHLGKKSGVHTYEMTDEILEWAKEEYVRIGSMIENMGENDFEPNYKYKYCGGRTCDYAALCVE